MLNVMLPYTPNLIWKSRSEVEITIENQEPNKYAKVLLVYQFQCKRKNALLRRTLVSLLQLKMSNFRLTHSFPMHPFSTPERRMTFWCFQEVEKGCIDNKWINLKFTVDTLQWRFTVEISYLCCNFWKAKKIVKQVAEELSKTRRDFENYL